MTDFSKALIRCSSLSCLFTEPVSKADKDAGNLSKTAKSHLIEVYANMMWGYERDVLTKQMRKGICAEDEGILLLSKVEGYLYDKNEEQRSNEWLSGHADIVTNDEIIDVKMSWDAFSFLPKLIEEVDKCYYYQLQGYMWLWGKEFGRICYCLVNTPQNIIEGEKYKLLRSMDVVSEESPEFLKAAIKLENNMTFDKIPIQQRIISHFVRRDEEVIKKIPEKVEKAREFISQIQKTHYGAEITA